ncbi:MAG: hypothetical protein ABI611_22055 [Solirubrobacteraceae bacterium]
MHDLQHRDRAGLAARRLGSSGTNARRTLQRDGATLARMVGNRAFCRLVQRDPLPPPNRQLPGRVLPADAEYVELAKIQYTQPRVSFTTSEGQTLGRMAREMAKNGWDDSRPADLVRTTDGRLMSLDHRRMFAAERAGLTRVSARVHGEGDKLSGETAARFAIRRGQVPDGINPRTEQPWKAKDKPLTWGDAMRFRAAVQDFYDPATGRPMKEPIGPQVLPGGSEKGGVRDPRFPREGSPNMPMRMPPKPSKDKPEPEPPAPDGGATPPKDPGGGPNPPATKPGPTSTDSGTGGSTKSPPTYTTGQRITALAAAAAIVANAAGNAIINWQNKRDIAAALERDEATLQSEQAARPQLGFLLVTSFAGGADSGEGPTAAARFKGVTWYRAETEYEAKAQVRDMTRDVTYSFAWIPPIEPVSDWGKDGLAMFADVSKMRFQRLGFAQLGGFKVKRSYPANLGEKSQKWASGLRFFVLKPPPTVNYRGVRGGNETESLTLSQRTVADGTVTAIMIDGDPIVPVIAADQDTANFFRADAALGLDHSGVVKERNVNDIRWLLPDQIEMVNGPYRQLIDYTKKNPDWRERTGFPKPKELGDPDSLEWDGIKGEWRQKRKR